MSETGKPISRIDGRMKVSGKATYSAEFNQPNMAYAFPVRATISKGKVTSINDAIIQKEPGVITIISHKNAFRLKPLDMQAQAKAGAAFLGENLPPLQDNVVHYPGQFIALQVQGYQMFVARDKHTVIWNRIVKDTQPFQGPNIGSQAGR